MGLALWLTVGRIFLSPVFLFIYLYYKQIGISLVWLPFILLTLVAVAELSDLFDGMAARKKNQVTDLGKLLDPMADSIFRISVFLAFTQGFVKVPLWLALIFFYRDSIISLLRMVCALRGFTLAARLSGKIKAVVQCVAALVIILLMIPYSLGWISLAFFRDLAFYTVLAAASYSFLSGVEYLVANRFYIKKALAK